MRKRETGGRRKMKGKSVFMTGLSRSVWEKLGKAREGGKKILWSFRKEGKKEEIHKF